MDLTQNSRFIINIIFKMDFQNIKTHQFVIGNYQFDIAINEDALNFDITCTSTYAKYTASINHESIKHNKNIQFFFATPQDLFTYFLGDCTNNLYLKDGVIHFNIETKVGKAVKNYECLIETAKEELAPDEVLNLKLEKLEKEVEVLKTENGKLKQAISKQEQQVGQLKAELQKCQKQLSRKDEAITEIFKDLKKFDEWKKQRASSFCVANVARKFTPDESNPHNKKFIQIGNRYRKNCGGTWDVLMSKAPVQKNQVSRYYIKQIKAGSNGSFMYGIGTEAVKGLNRAQDSKQFIGYYENTGFLYDQAESKKGGPKIKDGETVTIEVDTKKWKISWLIEGKKEAETNITNELRIKPIYLTIVVFNEQSEIEFM